jgi:hypothetical protein
MLTDDDLTRELTAAFHEQAGPITRTAVQPAALFRQAVRRKRRRATAVAVSAIAAATATAAVITLVTTAPEPASPAGTTASPAGVLLAAAVSPAPPPSAATEGMPPFYLVADHFGPVADVRDSATGQVTSTVPLPAAIDPKLTQVTAAGNDRMFVLAVFSLDHGTQFYELRITAAGRSAGLTRLAIPPLPPSQAADAIALTPDGTRLAVAVQTPGEHTTIEAITLATGALRTWTTTRSGLLENLSWDAAGRRLGYFWSGSTGSPGGLWLLDTGAPGSTLVSGRPLLPQTVGPDQVQAALISPDARTIIAAVTYNSTTKVGRGTVVGGIVDVSARTGRPLRTLLAERAAHSGDADWYVTGCLLPSIDTSGNHLLVSCNKFGRLDRGRFTAVPGAAPQAAVAAAW